MGHMQEKNKKLFTGGSGLHRTQVDASGRMSSQGVHELSLNSSGIINAKAETECFGFSKCFGLDYYLVLGCFKSSFIVSK